MRISVMVRVKRLRWFALFVLVLVMSGCSYMSVKHLENNPLSFDRKEELEMRFWNFVYVNNAVNDNYLLQGTAYPRMEVIPGWGSWIHNMRISSYLSDDQGRVLASDSTVYPTTELDPEQGVQFEFFLKPERISPDKETFITFGYNMQITEDRFVDPTMDPPLTGERSVFFASEGALSR